MPPDSGSVSSPESNRLQDPDDKQSAYVYEPLKADPSEIRLLELKPGEWDDLISCKLTHSELNDQSEYEALSYLWGNPTETLPILLGDKQHQVTTNLEAALRHLRYTSKTRVLWVDALCINQADLAERAEQVQKMHTIYAQSWHVIAWTGVSSNDSDEALDLLQRFGEFAYTLSPDPMGIDNKGGTASTYLTELGFPVESQNWTSLFNFFDRPYWSRVWVIQELVTRGFWGTIKPCTIVCGKANLAIRDYYSACAGLGYLMHSPKLLNPETGDFDGPLRSLILGNYTFPSRGMIMGQAILICEGESMYGPPTLEMLRQHTRLFEATDDRDKIYALLGMALEEDRFVRPDYKNQPTPFSWSIQSFL